MNGARLSRSLQCLERRRWLVMSLFIRMISFSTADKSASEKLRTIILLRMSYFSPNIFERLVNETHGNEAFSTPPKRSSNVGQNCVMPLDERSSRRMHLLISMSSRRQIPDMDQSLNPATTCFAVEGSSLTMISPRRSDFAYRKHTFTFAKLGPLTSQRGISL
jgi:hypothetical protein